MIVEYKKLKYNYNEVVIRKGKQDKIVKIEQEKLQYSIKSLTREVNEKILVVNWCKQKYEHVVKLLSNQMKSISIPRPSPKIK